MSNGLGSKRGTVDKEDKTNNPTSPAASVGQGPLLTPLPPHVAAKVSPSGLPRHQALDIGEVAIPPPPQPAVRQQSSHARSTTMGTSDGIAKLLSSKLSSNSDGTGSAVSLGARVRLPLRKASSDNLPLPHCSGCRALCAGFPLCSCPCRCARTGRCAPYAPALWVRRFCVDVCIDKVDFRDPVVHQAFVHYREELLFRGTRGWLMAYAVLAVVTLWGLSIACRRIPGLFRERRLPMPWWGDLYSMVPFMVTAVLTVFALGMLVSLVRSNSGTNAALSLRRSWHRIFAVFIALSTFGECIVALAYVDLYANFRAGWTVAMLNGTMIDMLNGTLPNATGTAGPPSPGTDNHGMAGQAGDTNITCGADGAVAYCGRRKPVGYTWTLPGFVEEVVEQPFFILLGTVILLLHIANGAVLVGLRTGFVDMIFFVVLSITSAAVILANARVGIVLAGPDMLYLVMTAGIILVVEVLLFVGLAWVGQRDLRLEFLKFYALAGENLKLRRPEIVPELLQLTDHELGAGGRGRVFKGHYSGVEVR